MSDVSAPQPGWYADPENPAGERWWNGSGWSDHKRDSTEIVPPPASPSFTVAPLAPTLGTAAPAAPIAPGSPVVPGSPVAPGTPVAPIAPTDSTGFTFGSPAPVSSDPRPDPYAPPAPGVAMPYYSSPYVGAPYGAPAYGSGVNGLALAGLLTSAIGWFIIPVVASIAGIILSAFGLRTARQREAAGNPNTGRGLAMAGLIVGIIIGAITVIFYIGVFALFLSPLPYE